MGANHYSRSSKLTGRHICIALTTLVAIAFAITVFLHSGPKVPNISSMWKQNQQGVQRTPRAFQARPEFNDLTASADDLWASIIPKNGGFVLKQKGKSWDVAGVSMFHQLHCLAMIREGIQVLQHENQHLKRSPHGGTHDHDSSQPMNDTIHWAHCLDYLMQVRIGRSFAFEAST